MLVPMPRRGFPRGQRFVLFLGSHSGSTEAGPCLFRRKRGDDFLEALLAALKVPFRIRIGHGKLLVNRFRLRFEKKFLKTWIVTDWVPYGIDLQTRDRNVFSGRDCEQLPKYSYRFLGVSSVR